MASIRAKGTSDKIDSWLNPPTSAPYVQIVEQPKQKELRFRYECEGRSAGSIPGENSSSDKKTYPTIKISNYKGCARVVVSCVTREKGSAKPRPHPHGLVGKDCDKGICKKNVSKGDKPIKFENLGIQCIKKKEIVTALQERTHRGIDPFNNFNLTTTDPKKLVSEYDLTVVCICFQVYIANEDAPNQPNVPLEPIITQPIFDKKGATLQIARVDRHCCSVKGDEELFILCDKIQKDDVKVVFFGDDGWTDHADFGPTDIHRQVAIVCKIPAYKDLNITQPVNVGFKLVRPSDGEESQTIDFKYNPDNNDPEMIGAKRKRNRPSYDSYLNQAKGPASREREKPVDVKEKLKRLVARRSQSPATQSKAPDEAFPQNTLQGKKFYAISSGNTGNVTVQEPMTTIDSAGLMNLLSPSKGLEDTDVSINIVQPINTIDESGVQMNMEALNPYLNIPVGGSLITPVSSADAIPMEQERSVLDLLSPMAQGYENVIVEDVPGSTITTIGSETTNSEVDMIDATIQQMMNGGSEVVIESVFPSLSNYLNAADIALLQQQVQQQEQQPVQLQLQQAVDASKIGDEYIYEEVHDSLNIPVFNSIDIVENVHDLRNNGGTM